MIKQKDASTPCDERPVKNICNKKPLTQKKTGGKSIMGNQGTTNWKFSAFLAIALMLVAGLFSTTAMAADGDGAMTVTAAAVTSGASTDINNLQAGSIVTLTFSYDTEADQRNDMDGGLIQMVIPWDFASDDDANAASAGSSANTGVGGVTGGTLMSGAKDKTVRIKLADDFTAAQTFTVTNIMVPIPNRLTDGDRSNRYEEYEFVASSRTRSGRLRNLDPIVETKDETADNQDYNSDGDVLDTSVIVVTIRQARVRVGNIGAASSGKFAITPDKVYETYPDPTERPRRFVIKFTADGPMWNSVVTVTFPGELDALDADQVAHLKAASGSLTPTGNSGYFRLVNTGGAEVSFSDTTGVNAGQDDGVGDDATPDTAQVITIDVVSMDKGQGFEIVYESKIPSVATNTATDSAFTAQANTRPGGSLTDIPAANIVGGKLRHKDGSGMMMAVPMYVEVGSGVKQYELQYTAETLLRNAVLRIQIPAELLGTTDTPANLQDPDGDATENAILRTKIGTGDDPRNSSNAGYVYTTNNYAESLMIEGTNTIVWREVNMGDKQVFRTIVRLATNGTADANGDIIDNADTAAGGTGTARTDTADDAIYPVFTVLDSSSPTATRSYLEDASDANLYAVRNQNADATFRVVTGATAGTALGTETDHVTYAAASEQTIRFRFKAVNTSIKGGTVSFRMPSAAGWTTPAKPNADADNPGRLTATQYASETAFTANTSPVDLKDKITAGRTVTIAVDGLPKGGIIDIVYTAGLVQYTADTVDIIGEFRTRSGASPRRAGRVEVEVTNVADGSGTATISPSGANATARAGSTDNTITIVYTAAGTMNGGQVAFEIPTGWGDMQDSNAQANNHVAIRAGGGGTLDATNPSYVGRRVAVANLEDFEHGDTVTFTYRNAEAPGDIGIWPFLVSSAGASPIDAGRNLVKLAGETAVPANSSDEDLLGMLYKADGGKLRVKIISAADGTGVATVEIRNSSSAQGKYDGSDVETQEVHAGDTSVYLLFTYTPHETITDGELEFTVPTNWTIPQEDDQGEAGYTYFEEVRSADIGSAVISGTSRTISVEIIHMTKDDSVQIHYGWHGVRAGGAEAPDDADTDTFGFRIKGSADGNLANMRTTHPEVKVREAASGSGTAEISPTTAAAAAMETVTITYTAAGEIQDGALRLTVPARTDPATWADASSENITVSGGGGSADHGSQYYETEDEDGDGTKYEALPLPTGRTKVPGIREVVYSGISLAAGGQVTFTYNTTVGATIGSHTFKLDFQGGEGPDLSATDPYAGFGALSDLAISVGEAAAGTGTATVMHDAIQAGDTAAEITFTYTAAGEIDYPGTFAVSVPTAWDSDGPAAADYTVAYQSVAADGTVTPLTGTAQSVEEAAPNGQDMMAGIRGAASPLIGAGHQVVFTYTSAAPATAGPYNFTVSYDGEQVGDPLTVNVLSAQDANTVVLSSTESLDGTATPVAITISLVDAGTAEAPVTPPIAATMSSDLSVMLSSDVATGMFSNMADGTYASTLTVLIMAGQIEAMVYYQDATGDAAMVTASSTLPDAMVDITTNVQKVYPGSVSFTIAGDKTAAGLGDTVTVTAMANGAPTFTVGSMTPAGVSMSAVTDMENTYSGTWSPVSDLHDGMHTVTVTLGSSSVSAADQLTVDTMDPVVTVTAPTAGMTVQNGATITISATAVDATAVTLVANVALLDSTAETDSVMFTDGSGTHTLGDLNTRDNGPYDITVTATDAAGNMGTGTVSVMLDNTRSFTSMIPDGVSLFHVPLAVDGLDTVADLKAALGEAVLQVIAHRGGSDYDADSDDVAITGDRGLILVTNGAIEHEFVGRPWGGGTATITVDPDANTLIGVPVNPGTADDPMMVSDLMALFPEGVAQAVVIAAGDNKYPRVSGADDPNDTAVTGDAAYLVVGGAAGTVTISGAGWSNGGSASAAPIALSGYQADTQTPLVSVYGSVVDEVTGVAKEGFRVKVKNLTTKAALSEVTSVEASDGYSITFVDLNDAHAARVGDVLEISADSPDPLVGVQPVRHIVTVDDVKNSRITLEDLVAYEIPAETALLNNYPNPFNPETWIPYHLSEDADVKLTIYNISGEVVRDIDVGHQTAAKYDTRSKAIYWDGRNRFGEQVASGVYFYHLQAGDFSGTRKMVILK